MERRKDNRGRVLKEGESQRKDGRYCFRYTQADGTRKYIYDMDLNRLREKEAKAAEQRTLGVVSSKATLDECFDRYIASKARIRQTTLTNYLSSYKRVRGTWLGLKKVSEIKKSDVLIFYKESSKEVSDSTILILHNLICATLNLAVEDNLIYRNPAIGCGRQYTHTKPKAALTKEETENFLSFAEAQTCGENYLCIVKMMLYTGMRIGEALALTWSDVDFKNRTILINKQCHRGVVCPPKTESSNRMIPMSNVLKDLLREIQDGDYFNKTGIVFRAKDNGYVKDKRVRVYINRVVKEYNATHEDQLPHITPHMMRHTFCTRLAEQGITPKALQSIMGHSHYSTTADVYVTASREHIMEDFHRVVGD